MIHYLRPPATIAAFMAPAAFSGPTSSAARRENPRCIPKIAKRIPRSFEEKEVGAGGVNTREERTIPTSYFLDSSRLGARAASRESDRTLQTNGVRILGEDESLSR